MDSAPGGMTRVESIRASPTGLRIFLFTFQTAKLIAARLRDLAARCARVVHEAFALKN
jgi:hypothetical protein